MEITLDELLGGNATTIKNNEYFPTRAYVEPFLERMQKYTNDFRVQVKLPNQLAINENDTVDIYNRVIVQAVLPDDMVIDNHSQVVGMVYGLDVRKPVVKFYSGALDMVCTNLCVFSPEQLSCAALEPEKPINYKPVNSIINSIEDTIKFIQKLKGITFDCSYQNTSQKLGDWIKQCMNLTYDNGFGKVKIATTTPIDAYKLLFKDKNSRYLVKDGVTDMYNVYGAFTQIFTDSMNRDIMNVCEKTLLVKQVLNIF